MAGIYIHIPFCERKCSYCDFYSITDLNYTKIFLDSIKKEIDILSGSEKIPMVNTIYFGGGTPSVLEPGCISEIIEIISNKFKVITGAEITIEANPNSIKKEALNQYRKAGINRISIGIQSFIPEELIFLQRIHTSAEAERSFYICRECGYDNISIDLIYSIPLGAPDNWKYNLNKAAELNPEHISAYSLIYEEETDLFKRMDKGEFQITPEETEAEMYLFTMKYLRDNGFIHYEVSNYAKPGKESRHNSSYWDHETYIGLGPSAHSYINNNRYWNYKDIDKYILALNNNKLPVESGEYIDQNTFIREKIFLSLRSKGLNIKELAEKYDLDFFNKYRSEIDQLMRGKHIKIEDNIIFLTDEGFLICDEICKMFM